MKRICDVCGREQSKRVRVHSTNGAMLCNKHYKQIRKYGRFLDNNPRTQQDPNEFHIDGDVAYMDIYDKDCNVIAQAIIDTEDIPKVSHIKWKLSSSGYVMNTPKPKGSNKHLSRTILGTENFVDHKDNNPLNNRKSNLREATKSQNSMNVNYKGVSHLKNGKYYAHIKLNQKMINLGVYTDENEAYLARWYAEVVLFKDFRYPKEKPEVPTAKEQEIKQYVDNKIQKYIVK